MQFGLFSVTLKNLRRKAFRSMVLVLSIGLLVCILVFGASFILSVEASLKRASDRFGADLLVVPMGARDFAEEVLLETQVKIFYMDRSIIERVLQVEGVKAVTHQTYLETILGVCCDIPSAKVVAFDPETDFIVKPWLANVLDRPLKKGEAILGFDAEENLGLLEVDSSVLFGKEFKVVGVLEKTGTGLDNAIFIIEDNLDDIIKFGKSTLKKDQISLIFTKVKEGYDPYKVGLQVEGAIIEVDVTSRNDMGKRIVATLKDINKVFLLTIIMASVLSVFLTWTVFSAIVNERAREIGIMRAIGARGGHIVTIFVIEVLLLGLLGSMVGIALGTYMSISLANVFTLLREMAATMTLMERFEVGLLGLAVGLLICVVGALSSILRIKNLEPLSALKEI